MIFKKSQKLKSKDIIIPQKKISIEYSFDNTRKQDSQVEQKKMLQLNQFSLILMIQIEQLNIIWFLIKLDYLLTKSKQYTIVICLNFHNYQEFPSKLKQLRISISVLRSDGKNNKFALNPLNYHNMYYLRRLNVEKSEFRLPKLVQKLNNNLKKFDENLFQLQIFDFFLMDKIKKLNFDSDQFSIDYLRPIPSLINANNLYWNEISILNNLQWNYTLQINSDKLSQVKEIIQKACCTQVSDQELKLIQDFLENDEYLLKNCGFTTQKLPDIIENNTNLVFFFLVKSVKSSDFQDYLDVFINIDVTPATIELIAMINYSIKIPPDFVTYYVYYCIQYCNNIKEKQTQTKIVKYVSIFIRHFLKTKAIVTKDLLTELQAFCIEFTRVNEVSQLFKSVKAFNELGA